MGITLYEFNSLNDDEKAGALLKQGTPVGERTESQYRVILWQFNNFYVEIYYSFQGDQLTKVEKFKSFVTTHLLNPYVAEVDLSELF